jgi:hypothetical protein
MKHCEYGHGGNIQKISFTLQLTNRQTKQECLSLQDFPALFNMRL